MRFSLKTMLLATTALAVTCYSLLYATPLLGDLYYTLALAAIAFGILAAIQRQGGRRAFWIGFSVVAIAYGWLTMRSAPRLNASMMIGQPANVEVPETTLLTSRLLAACYDYYCLSDKNPQRFRNITAYQRVVGNPPTVYTLPRTQTGIYDANYSAFMSTGHASIAILLGWLGGLASQRMYRARSAGTKPIPASSAVPNHGETS